MEERQQSWEEDGRIADILSSLLRIHSVHHQFNHPIPFFLPDMRDDWGAKGGDPKNLEVRAIVSLGAEE